MGDDSDNREICIGSPLCYRFAVDYKPQTIKITSIDLYDPDTKNKDEVWTTLPPPYSDQGEKAAMDALSKKAVAGEFDVPLCADGCDCELSKDWSKWSDWSVVDISAGFSIPGPNPTSPKLRYRVNGTVEARTRVKTGLCYKMDVRP